MTGDRLIVTRPTWRRALKGGRAHLFDVGSWSWCGRVLAINTTGGVAPAGECLTCSGVLAAAERRLGRPIEAVR